MALSFLKRRDKYNFTFGARRNNTVIIKSIFVSLSCKYQQDVSSDLFVYKKSVVNSWKDTREEIKFPLLPMISKNVLNKSFKYLINYKGIKWVKHINHLEEIRLFHFEVHIKYRKNKSISIKSKSSWM
jgi:hypothetical protein